MNISPNIYSIKNNPGTGIEAEGSVTISGPIEIDASTMPIPLGRDIDTSIGAKNFTHNRTPATLETLDGQIIRINSPIDWENNAGGQILSVENLPQLVAAATITLDNWTEDTELVRVVEVTSRISTLVTRKPLYFILQRLEVDKIFELTLLADDLLTMNLHGLLSIPEETTLNPEEIRSRLFKSPVTMGIHDIILAIATNTNLDLRLTPDEQLKYTKEAIYEFRRRFLQNVIQLYEEEETPYEPPLDDDQVAEIMRRKDALHKRLRQNVNFSINFGEVGPWGRAGDSTSQSPK